MNLWVKRVALGLTAASALFLFACLDEENILGFKNQNQKFNVSFKEFEIPSTLILFDSVRTSNYTTDGNRRLLVGKYSDPVMGEVEAMAYTQIVPGNVAKVKEAGAIFDSVTLHLHLDLYQYGTNVVSTERFAIHELAEDLTFARGKDYYTNTVVAYNPVPMGTGDQVINPTLFKAELNATDADTIIRVDVTLDFAYGQRLFDNWSNTSKDYTDFELFSNAFKGLAIKGIDNQKIVGFSVGNQSNLVLHYHTASVDSLKQSYFISNLAAGSTISIDRSSSALAGLTQPYQEFIPAQAEQRYIQSGSVVGTKLDFSEVVQFMQPIENCVINSAELLISGIDEPTHFDPPGNLFLQVLNNNNRLRIHAGSSNVTAQKMDSTILNRYNNSAFTLISDNSASTINKAGAFTVMNEAQSDFLRIPYLKDSKKYSGFISLFLQELITEEADKVVFSKFILYPGSPNGGKGVNRVGFNKSNIKLKIYYTTPTLN